MPAKEMIIAAIAAMKERNGSSFQAIEKYIRIEKDIGIEEYIRSYYKVRPSLH